MYEASTTSTNVVVARKNHPPRAFVPIFVTKSCLFLCSKVKAEHFPIVGGALLATLTAALGTDFTPEIKQSWEAAYALMSNIMVSHLVIIYFSFFLFFLLLFVFLDYSASCTFP